MYDWDDMVYYGKEPSKPSFLDTEEKWNDIVEQTNHPKKFEELVYRILGDENISHIDWYKLIKRLQKDILIKHEDPNICFMLQILEDMLQNLAQFICNCSQLNSEMFEGEEKEEISSNSQTDEFE